MMASFVSITSDYAKLDSEGSVQVEAKVLVANAGEELIKSLQSIVYNKSQMLQIML